jgi:hypothetical protein
MDITENNPRHAGFEHRLITIAGLEQRLSRAVANGRPSAWEDLVQAEIFALSMEKPLEDRGEWPLVGLYPEMTALGDLGQLTVDWPERPRRRGAA